MSTALANVMNINTGAGQNLDIQIQLCGIIASISNNKEACAGILNVIAQLGKRENPSTLVPSPNGKMRSLITVDAQESEGNNNGSPAVPFKQ